jgi:spermidine/putrescine transport system ATP-binding protein
MDPVLELRGVSKSFGPVRAVQDISLQVRRGEFLCIIGPSGCGKTTTLRLIAGFTEPDGGDLLLEGRSVVRVPPYRRQVNTVFQNYALFPHMTVAENIGFGLEMRKVPREERARRIGEILALVELPDYGPRAVQQLSGGEQQRVALARALVNNPTILLLDEPLGALDQKVRRRMQVELKRIHRELGITFIHVTHDQEEALAMADRIAVMNRGRLEQIGGTLEVYARPRTSFVAEFVGESNRFEGPVTERPGEGAGLEAAPGVWIAIPAGDGVRPGVRVRVYVRPEQVGLGPAAEPSLANCFKGTVQDIIFLGDTARYYVSLAQGVQVMASLSGSGRAATQPAGPGETVTVGWPREAAMVFPG